MLFDNILKHTKSETYPMHMPGHKRNHDMLPNEFPYNLDITEINKFDDLSKPHGILKETQKLAAKLYGSDKAFILINGSTVGILASIGAHANAGDKILFSKSCHRSVHNAVTLFKLQSVQYSPQIDIKTGIECSTTPDTIEKMLKKDPDIKLIVITSPSYEGVLSDLNGISKIAKSRKIPLIIDSAHGAHLGFSDRFPKNSVESGADIVVTSLHKTLPALTQCSLLHICGNNANIQKTQQMLNILQTSSPSYVLMASIDHCLRLVEQEKSKLFENYYQYLTNFYQNMSNLKKLRVIGADESGFLLQRSSKFYDFDPGKIVIVTKNTTISSSELMDILRNDYKIELEKSGSDYALAMTSICDKPEGYKRLAKALIEIDINLH